MNVQLPDGTVVAFPDGMSQEAISAELTKQFPAPAGSPAATPLPAVARIPLGLGAAAASGLANTLALPGLAQEKVIAPVANWMAEKTGLPASMAGPGTVIPLPTPGQVTGLTDRLGISNNPALAPQSELERLGQAGAAGVGASLPLLPLGGPLALAATGAAGGVAGEGARALGAPVPVQIAAGFAGGLGVQGLTSAFSRGIPHIAADLGSSTTLQEAGEAAQEAARTWLTKVPAGQTPVPGTLQAKLASAWAPIDSMIPKDASTTLSNFHTALQNITTDAGSLAPLEKLLRPSLPERLREAVFGTVGDVKIPPSPRIAAAPEAQIPATPRITQPATGGGPAGARWINPPEAPGQVVAGGTLINPAARTVQPISSGRIINQPGTVGTGSATWQDVSKLRSAVGDAMSNPKVVNDIGTENLSHLYSALTADMQGTASAHGPRAALAFDEANRESARLYRIAQGPVARIVSGPKANVAEDPKPGDVASYFLNKGHRDGSELALLRSEMPQVVDELAAAHLRLNPDARAWQRLAPEAQQALVPSARDRAIVASTFQPKVPARDQIERSILGTLLGEVALPAVLGLPPGVATAVGAVAGAATPYVMQGARGAARNPLFGIAGAAGAAGNPAMSYRLTEPNPLGP